MVLSEVTATEQTPDTQHVCAERSENVTGVAGGRVTQRVPVASPSSGTKGMFRLVG